MKQLLSLVIIILTVTFSIKSLLENESSIEKKKLERIELYFGEVGLDTIAQYNSGSIAKHGSGINFTDINWNPPHLGKLKVYSSRNGLEVDNIFWLQGYEFRKGFGLQLVHIVSSLHLEEYATKEQVYLAYVDLMKQLQDKGWRQYFYPSSARLSPQNNIMHIINARSVLDPSYTLTKKEWDEIMFGKARNFYLDLQNGDLILNIKISKEYEDEEKVQYMINYDFSTKQYFNINRIKDFDDLSFDEKKEQFIEDQKNNIESRRQDEERMILKGYQIDETYIDDIYDYKPY